MANKRKILILCFSWYLFFICPSYSYTDTILQGQQLRDWEQLHSENRIFRLQFFSLGASRNRYLGIFYNNQVEGTYGGDDEKAIWVANRNTPVPDTSGDLEINDDGRLKITSDNGIPIILSNAALTRNGSATLLDSGNLVLREMDPDGSIKQVLWQSFDYPTDTLLPRMKLGMNFKTGKQWSLTSWISDEVPAAGSFTFGGDLNGTSQLIIWWQGNVYWTSGLWHNGQFQNAPQVFNDIAYNISFAANENEKYLVYSVDQNHAFPSLTIYPTGLLRERQGVQIFAACSKSLSGTSVDGCMDQEILPKCRKADNYRIEGKEGYISTDELEFDESYNMSLFDWEAKCKQNCSCVAFASINDNGTECEIWSQPINFISVTSARQSYVLASREG